MTFDRAWWWDQFAGDPIKIDAERRRLAELRDLLSAVRRTQAYDWTGAAADGHDNVTSALVKQCQRASDRHDEAGLALDLYQQTLATTRGLATDALDCIAQDPLSLPAQAARESLPRWRDQLRAVAVDAVGALRMAANDLLKIQAVVPHLPEPTPKPVRPLPVEVEQPSQPVRRPEPPHEPPPTDLLSMLSYAKPLTIPSPVPVSSWPVWQRGSGRRIGRFGLN
ncbi:hypothetical protein [Actinocrispum wychmicini]|uniref:PPE family protein n=1 Tax=Actinocrispum wychmicini TaxID=1213861 RepID=A0A4R2IRS1_9PSEU|nr:hypothetical protein [Actinocrispum wychmicini]TCO47973.1 hypothetical protein EV192_11625 [Actinocrispum wychmicini]